MLSSLTSRARRLVESELDDGAAVSPRDVAKARRMIADLVLEMAQRNEIEIAVQPNSTRPDRDPTRR